MVLFGQAGGTAPMLLMPQQGAVAGMQGMQLPLVYYAGAAGQDGPAQAQYYHSVGYQVPGAHE